MGSCTLLQLQYRRYRVRYDGDLFDFESKKAGAGFATAGDLREDLQSKI
jgi:hypothetical protein